MINFKVAKSYLLIVFTCLSLSYEDVESIAQYLKENTKYHPIIGIICGSGLGNLVNLLENPDVFPYDNIENFPVSTGLHLLQYLAVCSCSIFQNCQKQNISQALGTSYVSN